MNQHTDPLLRLARERHHGDLRRAERRRAARASLGSHARPDRRVGRSVARPLAALLYAWAARLDPDRVRRRPRSA